MTQLTRLILSLTLLLFSINAYAAEEKLLVDEQLNDSIRLRIIDDSIDSNNQVKVLVTLRNTLVSNEFLAALERFSLEQGFDYQLDSYRNKQQLAFVLSNRSLELLFNFFKQNQTEFIDASSIDLMISGKVNQQKTLGKLHSQWGKFESDNATTTSYQHEFLPDDKKDKQLLWTKAYSAILTCDISNNQVLDFHLNEKGIFCQYKQSPQSLTPGDIANLKSNLYSKLLIERNDDNTLLRLLSNFDVTNSIELLDEFIGFLPLLSIEEIHALYLENAQQIPQLTTTESPTERIYEHSESSESLFSVYPNDETIWGVSVVIDESVMLCDFINCNLLKQQLAFEYFENDKTWVFMRFHKTDLEKQVELIAEQLVKPMSFKNLFSQHQVKIMAFGPSDKSPLLPLLQYVSTKESNKNALSSFTQLAALKDSTKSDIRNCNGQYWFGSPFWASQLLRNYHLKYSDSQPSNSAKIESWTFFVDYCPDQELDIVASSDQFDLLKDALLTRVKGLNEQSYQYRTVANYYSLDIKTLLVNQLEALTLEEYQYWLSLGRDDKTISAK